jgi:hypothetical protein
VPIEASMKMADMVGQDPRPSCSTARQQDRTGRARFHRHPASQNDFLLHDKPALISLFLILLVVLPFLSALAGFNQTAGDIGSRGLLPCCAPSAPILPRPPPRHVPVHACGDHRDRRGRRLYVVIKVKFYPTSDVAVVTAWLVCGGTVRDAVGGLSVDLGGDPDAVLSLLVSAGGLAVWVIPGWIMKSKMAELILAYVTPWGFSGGC